MALTKRALSLLDAAQAGSSPLACHLAHALDTVNGSSADFWRQGPQSEPPSGRSDATLLCEFTGIDGELVAISPAAVSLVRSDECGTSILFVDGSQAEVQASVAEVAAKLGLFASRGSPANGLIPIDAARHHLRNLLTIVSALTNQVLDEDEPTLDKGRELAARVAMLSRISDLIVQPEAHVTDLQTLVHMALVNAGSSRIRVSGPTVPIGPGTAAALALALHELEVHALENGALSTADGYVSVRWEINGVEQPYLWLQWADRDGPRARLPLAGWSERLLTIATPRRLSGTGGIEELPTGLLWSLHAPVGMLHA